MEASTGVGNTLVQVVFILLAIAAVYYLYRYLFGGPASTAAVLIDGKQKADVEASGTIVIPASSLPPIYEGGELTISMWLYIQNWNYRLGFNKHILSIGGQNFDTLRVFLAPDKNTLKVRVHTREAGQVTEQAIGDSLTKAGASDFFGKMQTGADMIEGSNASNCDLKDIDMQRWINVTLSLNGRSCDVYLDGKLARSCVLPSFYKVDSAGYQVTVLGNGGFGGLIANTTLYGNALSPDDVYKNYMQGPEPISTFTEWIKSFFRPSRIV